MVVICDIEVLVRVVNDDEDVCTLVDVVVRVVVKESDGVIVTGTSPVGGATFLEGLSPSSVWLMHAVQIGVVCRVQRVASGRKGGAKGGKKEGTQVG